MRKFDNYSANLAVLATADQQDLGNEFIQSGIADKFALQFELSWKLLKSLLQLEGDPLGTTGSPRDILKGAFRSLGFLDEDLWLGMLRDRSIVEHTYDKDELARIVSLILSDYIPAFQSLRQAIEDRYGDELAALA